MKSYVSWIPKMTSFETTISARKKHPTYGYPKLGILSEIYTTGYTKEQQHILNNNNKHTEANQIIF